MCESSDVAQTVSITRPNTSGLGSINPIRHLKPSRGACYFKLLANYQCGCGVTERLGLPEVAAVFPNSPSMEDFEFRRSLQCA
jgi:hypothetical protein